MDPQLVHASWPLASGILAGAGRNQGLDARAYFSGFTLPGSQKSIKQWPNTIKHGPEGHYFAYSWAPGAYTTTLNLPYIIPRPFKRNPILPFKGFTLVIRPNVPSPSGDEDGVNIRQRPIQSSHAVHKGCDKRIGPSRSAKVTKTQAILLI